MLNIGFTVLAMYHLAYLGLMFGSRSPEEDDLKLQVSNCMLLLVFLGFCYNDTLYIGFFYDAYSKKMVPPEFPQSLDSVGFLFIYHSYRLCIDNSNSLFF